MDGLQAVRELERYLQQVDALRVRIQGAAIPPNDIIGHGRADNRLLFIELESADRDLLQALLELHEHSISVVEGILARREDILRQFDSHL
jgi:23S rRNA A2030 N6-methylase RlmJ